MNNKTLPQIFVTSLSLRFYEKDGWDEHELKIHLRRGSIVKLKCQENGAYWVLGFNSELKAELLTLNPFYGQERWKDVRGKCPMLILEERNW